MFTTKPKQLDRLKRFDRLNPETLDIAKNTTALTVCMTLSLHAGYAEAQTQGTKGLVLLLLTAPAAVYLINKPKPRIYQFGSTLEDFQPFGSGHTDLPVAEVGCSRREAIVTGSEDAQRNETTQPETDSAVTANPEQGDASIPLIASFQPQAKKLGVGSQLVRTAGLVISKLLGLAFRNVSTAVGLIVIIVLVIAGVFG